MGNLVSCPDCGREISSAAVSCPQCGRPMAATVIEATGKKYKKNKIIGVLAILLGLLFMLSGGIGQSIGSALFGVAVTLFGIVFYASARFGAWWKHG